MFKDAKFVVRLSETLIREVVAWEAARNTTESELTRRFTTADARTKLKTLSPTLQVG